MSQAQPRSSDPKRKRLSLSRAPSVLLVDANVQLRQALHLFLERQGFDVLPAISGTSALAVVRAHPWPVRVLVVDLDLPDMNGFEVAERVAREAGPVPTVFTSATILRSAVPAWVFDAGHAFLEKPFTLEQLEAAVRKAAG